jgi:hypothetical protein
MRILLVDNTPAAVGAETSPLASLAGLLAATAGHQIELLFAAADEHDLAAETPHDPAATDPSEPLAAWDRWRALLDEELLAFDPHLVHVVGLGAWGHLALESGAVYVLELPQSAAADPLAAARSSPLRRWHEQTIENAARIVVGCEAARAALVAELGPLDGRIVVCDPAEARADAAAENAEAGGGVPARAAWWTDLYRAAYEERYGHAAEPE